LLTAIAIQSTIRLFDWANEKNRNRPAFPSNTRGLVLSRKRSSPDVWAIAGQYLWGGTPIEMPSNHNIGPQGWVQCTPPQFACLHHSVTRLGNGHMDTMAKIGQWHSGAVARECGAPEKEIMSNVPLLRPSLRRKGVSER